MPSGNAEKMAAERLTMLALAVRLPLQGGLPVMNNGECLVAVGYPAGCPPQDKQVAQAGLAALKL